MLLYHCTCTLYTPIILRIAGNFCRTKNFTQSCYLHITEIKVSRIWWRSLYVMCNINIGQAALWEKKFTMITGGENGSRPKFVPIQYTGYNGYLSSFRQSNTADHMCLYILSQISQLNTGSIHNETLQRMNSVNLLPLIISFSILTFNSLMRRRIIKLMTCVISVISSIIYLNTLP